MRALAVIVSVMAVCAALDAAQETEGPTFKAGNRTVAVYATVTGADGRLVANLTREAFSILDNGRRQDLSLFSSDLQPITVVMLLDRSGSMRGNFTLVQKAAEEFVQVMRAEFPVTRDDWTFVITGLLQSTTAFVVRGTFVPPAPSSASM